MIKDKKLTQVDDPNNGYVYVLSNPSMPGLVKIGFSKYGGSGRADSFYKNDTGVPTPFKLEFEIYCANPRDVEREVHSQLNHKRVNKNREFFAVLPDVAVKLIVNSVCSVIGLVSGEWHECVFVVPEKLENGLVPPDYVDAVEEMLRDPELVVKYKDKSRERFKAIRMEESGAVH